MTKRERRQLCRVMTLISGQEDGDWDEVLAILSRLIDPKWELPEEGKPVAVDQVFRRP